MIDKQDLIAEFLKKGRPGSVAPGKAPQADADEEHKGAFMKKSTPESDLFSVVDKIRKITATDEYAMEFSSGATNEEIGQFEKNNSIILPALVKEWLHLTDGCFLFDRTVQLYGVAHKPYIDANPEGVSGNFIEIGVLNSGERICAINNSPKIVRYGETIREYTNFKEFLEFVIEIGENR